jgi:AraC-like DNA-binding protein
MSTHWNYSPYQPDTSIELGRLEVTREVTLAAHFHWQLQAAAVVQGWRAYSTPAGVLTATPGDLVIIPAFVPHASWGSSTSLVTHVYIPHDHPGVRGILAPQIVRCSRQRSPRDILQTIGSLGGGRGRAYLPPAAIALRAYVLSQDLDVRSIAAQLGYSTDGFIRSFRRQFGMTPAAYRLANRLANARLLLRKGEPVADVAYATSFADQSHLGRQFRRAYGTTPAAYRSAFAIV